MPRLPRLTGWELAKALQRAGFAQVRQTGSHASYQSAHTLRTTTVPLTRTALPVGTIASILRQAGVTAEELERYTRGK